MVYQTIRLCAFKLKSELRSQQYYVMNFPEDAKSHIIRLTAKRDKLDRASLPVKSLYKGLRLAPGLIQIGKVSPKENEFWLYSPHQLSQRMLTAILDYWIETEFPDEAGKKGKVGITSAERKSAMNLLNPQKLIWETKTISYTNNFDFHPNGTANLSGNDFVLLPHIVAAKLSQPGLKFEVDGAKLQFYRSMTGQSAELISWPPLHPTIDKKTYYYSIVLTLKIVQVPSQPYPQFHITPSIRRWLSSLDSKLSNNHGSNAYIREKLNWGKELNPDNLTEYFISCRMKSKQHEADWDENLANLLKDLDILSIEPKEILANPAKFLEGKPNIGLTYKDGMEPENKVGKGFPTTNSYELFKQITAVLKDYWEPIECQRQKTPRNRRSPQTVKLKKPDSFDDPYPKKKEETDEAFQLRLEKIKQEHTLFQKQLREKIRQSIGENLTIWLWYIKDKNLPDRLKAIQYCLGLEKAEPGKHTFPEGLTVNICLEEGGVLAQRLDFQTYKPKITERKEAINKRKSEIAEILKTQQSKLSGKVGIWFELYGQEIWKPDFVDPKSAIRLGFADLGFVSEFITPEPKSYHQKAISSFIDLLRSLGVRMTPSQITLPKVDKNTPINEVGLWLINRKSKTSADGTPQLIPVMVKMCSLTGEIMAIFRGIEQWIPYDKALTRINKEGSCLKNDNKGKATIRTFIQETLNRNELREKPTILYCHAQNIRQAWTWLKDPQISDQGLSFAELENPVFEQFPGLRVIRLRSGDETPEWFGIDGENVSGFITGLFQNPDNERVFYSIGKKTATMMKDNQYSRIKKPEKHWVHPSIVEITIGYCQENDKNNLLELAAIAHESRHGVLQYEDFLEVPRVLHYAKQMADYVLMLSDDDDESDE
ncbi:pPIWI_RE module domain-containing protein [Floridanema aerugineum]|uniref:PPIWI_RE module domain-containing protein n=1 Tax=Floridaenema aerugineum BLCC-F46 TaxID=3153654 RepID=A0ABV4XAU8_9CYAN